MTIILNHNISFYDLLYITRFKNLYDTHFSPFYLYLLIIYKLLNSAGNNNMIKCIYETRIYFFVLKNKL